MSSTMVTSDSHVSEEAGEFYADGAGADDEEAFRQERWHHRVFVGPDEFAVGFEAGELAGAGAGGKNYVVGAECCVGFAGFGDVERVGGGEFGFAVEYRDFVFAEEMADAGC